jgi:hypothetical protein
VDPLSHVLSLSNVESAVCAELRAGGDWAVTFPGQQHIKFGVVVSGSCRLAVEDAGEPIVLRAGDSYLVTGARPYRLGSDPTLPPVLPEAVWPPGEELGHCGSGCDVTLVGGRFTFDRANADVLLRSLPPVIHLTAEADESGVIRAAMRLIAHEMAARPHPYAGLFGPRRPDLWNSSVLPEHGHGGHGERPIASGSRRAGRGGTDPDP